MDLIELEHKIETSHWITLEGRKARHVMKQRSFDIDLAWGRTWEGVWDKKWISICGISSIYSSTRTFNEDGKNPYCAQCLYALADIPKKRFHGHNNKRKELLKEARPLLVKYNPGA